MGAWRVLFTTVLYIVGYLVYMYVVPNGSWLVYFAIYMWGVIVTLIHLAMFTKRR